MGAQWEGWEVPSLCGMHQEPHTQDAPQGSEESHTPSSPPQAPDVPENEVLWEGTLWPGDTVVELLLLDTAPHQREVEGTPGLWVIMVTASVVRQSWLGQQGWMALASLYRGISVPLSLHKGLAREQGSSKALSLGPALQIARQEPQEAGPLCAGAAQGEQTQAL